MVYPLCRRHRLLLHLSLLERVERAGWLHDTSEKNNRSLMISHRCADALSTGLIIYCNSSCTESACAERRARRSTVWDYLRKRPKLPQQPTTNWTVYRQQIKNPPTEIEHREAGRVLSPYLAIASYRVPLLLRWKATKKSQDTTFTKDTIRVPLQSRAQGGWHLLGKGGLHLQ